MFPVSPLFRLKSVTIFSLVKELYAPHGTGLEDFHSSGSSVKLTKQTTVYTDDEQREVQVVDSVSNIQ